MARNSLNFVVNFSHAQFPLWIDVLKTYLRQLPAVMGHRFKFTPKIRTLFQGYIPYYLSWHMHRATYCSVHSQAVSWHKLRWLTDLVDRRCIEELKKSDLLNETKHSENDNTPSMSEKSNLRPLCKLSSITATYYSLVMPYGIRDLGQHLLR